MGWQREKRIPRSNAARPRIPEAGSGQLGLALRKRGTGLLYWRKRNTAAAAQSSCLARHTAPRPSGRRQGSGPSELRWPPGADPLQPSWAKTEKSRKAAERRFAPTPPLERRTGKRTALPSEATIS